MNDETRLWLSYADENLEVADLALAHGHLNARLQNAQQALEKLLKAVIIEKGLEFRRTHSIRELVQILATEQIDPELSDDDIDLMDTICLLSKYPVLSALPNAMPTQEICQKVVDILCAKYECPYPVSSPRSDRGNSPPWEFAINRDCIVEALCYIKDSCMISAYYIMAHNNRSHYPRSKTLEGHWSPGQARNDELLLISVGMHN